MGTAQSLMRISAASVFDEPTVVSPMPPAVMLVFFGGAAFGAVALAGYWAAARRDWLPIVCCVGAVVCGLNEPIFDVLGKIVYADNNVMAFTAFGRRIPLFLVIGYIPWVGLLPYVIARGMATGWSARRLYAVSIAGVVSVAFTEFVNTFVKSWEYYGGSPLKFFGGVAAMACVPLAGGFLLYALAFPLQGWKRLSAGFFIPLMTLPMMFAGVGLPLYLALYTPASPLMRYLAVAALFVFIAVANVGIVKLTQFWQTATASALDRATHHGVQLGHLEQPRP
ncbi:hypothetical protein OG874_10775 [Nocardia sp. NBC_00565]|uniref:hypothetical protein n=1 Tax=Nocardia sp. NBC_00565 TaxID=2975993 RepID=UPI002E804824|nr:hypothetical protein [Nocardia sp. NBC_00565]WUC05589.1 hypothetical protein OG874_10775 [Nocardia sp. NBC_00565]